MSISSHFYNNTPADPMAVRRIASMERRLVSFVRTDHSGLDRQEPQRPNDRTREAYGAAALSLEAKPNKFGRRTEPSASDDESPSSKRSSANDKYYSANPLVSSSRSTRRIATVPPKSIATTTTTTTTWYHRPSPPFRLALQRAVRLCRLLRGRPPV